jgi:hypothetical protein
VGRAALCCNLDFAIAFDPIDHEALWRGFKELNIPELDLLQSIYSGASEYYEVVLPYGW